MTIFAPFGLTLAQIPDRETATSTALGIGIGVLALG